jgi:two-component sensor histidine kinase
LIAASAHIVVIVSLTFEFDEDLHEWLVAHVSLGTVSPADHRTKGTRLVKAQSTRRDFHNPRVEIIELRQQLLDELNHRLKDNLQVLKGLLRTHGAKPTMRKLAMCYSIRAGASVR